VGEEIRTLMAKEELIVVRADVPKDGSGPASPSGVGYKYSIFQPE
jgi:hypothetical protein